MGGVGGGWRGDGIPSRPCCECVGGADIGVERESVSDELCVPTWVSTVVVMRDQALVKDDDDCDCVRDIGAYMYLEEVEFQGGARSIQRCPPIVFVF